MCEHVPVIKISITKNLFYLFICHDKHYILIRTTLIAGVNNENICIFLFYKN